MKVFVKGKGPVTLSQANYVAQGGQASVFQKNGTAYKVYTDPKTAIPEAKFAPLAAIDDPDVVKPIDLLVDDVSSQPIGYTMRFVQDTYALCQLFPKVFRDRNNIGPDKVSNVVEAMQKHVENVHRAGVLVVDLNEMNILVSQAIDAVYMIDVDSYQTPGFRAEVIMPSVRDWSVSSSHFSELSDWFSFAVLVCQLYLGIHPYKGTHAGSAHVPPEQRLEHRMRHHVSVFDPGVSVPKACASPDVIPAVQRAWLRAVLQEGKRLPPPAPGAVAAAPVVQESQAVLKFGGRLLVSELADLGQPILGWYVDTASMVALLADGIVLNGVTVARGPIEGTTLLGSTPKFGRPIALNLHKGVLRLYELAERRVTELPIAAREIAKSGDRFYVRNDTQVLEVDFREQPDRTMVSASHPVASTLENASKLFDGVAIQNMLGSTFVSLFPRTRAGYQLRVPALDGFRVVDARFEGQTLMVIGAKGGEYHRLVFWCDDQFGTCNLRTTHTSAPGSINFTVTDAGVCVSVTEDETIAVYPKDMMSIVSISDPAIGGDMRLCKSGGKTAFVRGNKVFSITMRSP